MKGPSPNEQKRGDGGKGRKKIEVSTPHLKPQCPRCERKHSHTLCKAGLDVCYRCGGPRHMARNCKTLPREIPALAGKRKKEAIPFQRKLGGFQCKVQFLGISSEFHIDCRNITISIIGIEWVQQQGGKGTYKEQVEIHLLSLEHI